MILQLIMVSMLYLVRSIPIDIRPDALTIWRQLYRAGRNTKFERSTFIIRRVIRLTVETGLACALCAGLVLALFLGSPDTNVQVVAWVI